MALSDTYPFFAVLVIEICSALRSIPPAASPRSTGVCRQTAIALDALGQQQPVVALMLDEPSAVFTNSCCKLVNDHFPIGAGSASRHFNKMHSAKPGDIGDFLKAKKGGNKGCVDELDCSNSCSGLGQSLATSRACTGNLLNDLAAALGRAPKGQVVKHPEWVSKWNPDQGQIPETDFCLSGGGSTGPNRVSTPALWCCAQTGSLSRLRVERAAAQDSAASRSR
jgi:hypothetical protein